MFSVNHSSVGSTESLSGLSENRRRIFQIALGPTWDTLLSNVQNTNGTPPSKDVNESTTARLKLATVIADAVQGDVDIASKILQDPKVKSTRDVALCYGHSRVQNIAASSKRAGTPTTSVSNKVVSGAASTADNSTILAINFRRRLFATEPTAVLQQMIASENESENPSEKLPIHANDAIRTEVACFLGDRPNFNLRTHSVLTEIQADERVPDGGKSGHLDVKTRREVAESLKLLQRVQALAPVPEAIKPLLEQGMTSALRVSSLPKKTFVQIMAPRLLDGVGGSHQEAETVASNIHDHAVLSRARTDHSLIQIHQAVKGSGLTAIDGNTTMSDRKEIFTRLATQATGGRVTINLEQLFDDMDFCECDDCQDVTSPTAYYVDLLQYLRNDDLSSSSSWPNTGQKGYQNTILEKLFIRRPDLQHLKLTCENANTVLPYIDLSNEVMESFVTHAKDYAQNWTVSKQVSLEAWNIDGEDTNELLASPSHTRKTAYCILKESVYPIASLPYFQPLDAIRLYLQYLGVSRDELIDTFRLSKSQWKVPSSLLPPEKLTHFEQLRDQLQDRAVAAEYLGLSPDEYVIIARESIWPIGCSEFSDDGTILTSDQYLQDIGVLPMQKYWGYDTTNDLLSQDNTTKLGLTWVKAQFLNRAGLSYAETADLARTYFVNPMFPSGKDKAILDSIRFSYRALQKLAAAASTDPAQQKNAISSFLVATQPWVQAIEIKEEPPTGNPLVINSTPPTFSEKEIKSWVSLWFDCIGKLIVLESGQGPVLPVPGYIIWVPQPNNSNTSMKLLSTSVAIYSSALASATSSGKQDGITVVGYLDTSGEIHDNTSQLVGFVAMNGKVLGNNWHPLRKKYPNGQLLLFQSPKTTSNAGPVAPDVTSGTTLFTVEINADSFLEYIRFSQDLPPAPVKWTIAPESCSIDEAELVHLNGNPLELSEWDRINRFIRLYKKLQPNNWTIPQLDSALKGLWNVPEIAASSVSTTSVPATTPDASVGTFSFKDYQDKGCSCNGDDCDDDCDPGNGKSPCDPSNYSNITPGFLKELVSVIKLAGLTGLDLDKLLCFWSDIGTFGDNSLYARLFLTQDLKSIDIVFQPDDNGNYLTTQPKIGDHVPVLVAALQLKANIFDAVLQQAKLTRNDIISVTNLTKLYRYTLLAQILGIKVADLLDALDIFQDPFAGSSQTLDMYHLWDRMSNAGFSVKQLHYIILGYDDPLHPIGPTKVTILRTTKAIMDGLAAINLANPDLTAQQELTLAANDVKVKATLYFGPTVVDSIMGLIEGTQLYTTNAPVGLVVDSTKVSSKIIYKDPLVPPNRRATLSVTGNLTGDELATAEGLFPGNNDWISAFQRLHNQAINLVKATLSAVFPNNIDDAVKALTQGDVSSTPPTSDTDTGDPGTALAKRTYFMQAFIPFLRSYLESQLIVTTMSGVTSVSADICTLLLTQIITTGPVGSKVSAMQVLKGLQSYLSSNSSGAWTGYLMPQSSDTYIFYGYGNTEPNPLVIDGASIPFVNQNPDPSDLWSTAPIPLTGGKLYPLIVTGQTIPGDLQWKTNRSGLAPIPTNCLIPDASVSDSTDVFTQMAKASMIVQGFNVNVTEADYFQSHGSEFDSFDFNTISFNAWKRLLAYTELRGLIPQREKTLIDLFKWASLNEKSNVDDLSAFISSVTTWDQGQIKILFDPNNFDMEDAKLFENEIAMTKLAKVFNFITKVGISDLALLLTWTDLKLDFNPIWKTAKSVLHTIRGKYSVEDFEQAIKPSHDQLRKDQRDALIAYLLVQQPLQQWGVQDADGLFEFFLLDVQMGSCMQTSRLKQAISSVQLFVQRCMLGLEENADPKVNIPNDALDSNRWQWMSKQTVWTANRKVFLYPENWIISSLRDDKTPIYTDMEGEMLQRDLNPTNVLESFREYVTRLDQIAHLRASGIYLEERPQSEYVLHCVAATAAAPFLFFYRTFDSLVHEWQPWSQIQVDIPMYNQPYLYQYAGGEFPPTTAQVLMGCYTAPIVWNSRVLLFIGQLNQKAVPNSTALTSDFGSFTAPDSTQSASDMAPYQCWEIQLAYTEYRSGRWSQKQICSDSFLTSQTTAALLPDVDSFQFIPQSTQTTDGDTYISIEVWQCIPGGTPPQSFIGNFEFHGSIIQKGDLHNMAVPTNWTVTNFHLINGRSPNFIASSLQKSNDGTSLPYLNKNPCVTYSSSNSQNGVINYADTTTDLFYHPFTSTLLGAANSGTDIGPVVGVFGKLASTIEGAAFGTGANEIGADGNSYPTYSELSKPYSNYNWELGFHALMQIADGLASSQQFDSALDMIHYVFNPYADGDTARRVWQWLPFKNADSDKVLETILDRLKPRTLDQNISQWRDHPFQPHMVARGRIVSYMKWTVMMYINILISYGDYYFRRRTLEDIPLAIQCYVLASHMYGPKGEMIPKQGKKVPQTYYSLLDKWDAFSNAAVQLEIMFPFSNQTPFPWGVDEDSLNSQKFPKNQIALANVFGFATSTYFCLPTNPNLQSLRTTIDQRLFNIRNCLDIDGKPLPLALWEPPIDPGQLVQAVASGLSLESALNDLNASLPNYRFSWLLSRALEVCSELKSQESAFLSIKEKRDGEALQRLRSSHDITMSQLTLDMKKVQLDEAKKTLDTLVASQASPQYRYTFYSSLAGADVPALGNSNQPFKEFDITIEAPSTDGDLHLTSSEKREADQASEAQIWNLIASGQEVVAGVLHAVPSFNLHTTPMGCGVEVAWGMTNIASSIQATARMVQIIASDRTFKATEAARKTSNVKQYQDRIHQMNLAGYEYEHIQSQITTHMVRIQLANMDITNQQQMLDNANEVDQFLRNKYTNDDLYGYLENSTRQNMYQTYLLAYDLAKKAELAYRFERKATDQPNFISFGYFDPGRDGLQSGQKMYLSLKNMEAAYQADRGYDFELTKSVSLRQLNPYALLTLRETGSCQIDLPEVLFDIDFPGHYFRRLKTVNLTVPCIVGPYTGVNATLRLLSHRYRWDPTSSGSSKDYIEQMEGKLDDRFRTDRVPIDAVATSSAQNDSGVFELSLRDERYLPFEGAGAIGSWSLQLPISLPQFDYSTISDVIMTIRYTSCDGGATLRKAAASSVADFVATVEGYSQSQGLLTLFDLRSEFASEWAKVTIAASSSSSSSDPAQQVMVLRDLNSRLPAFTRGRKSSTIRATDVTVLTTLPLQIGDMALDFAYVPLKAGDAGNSNDTPFDSGPTKIGASMSVYRISEADNPVGTFALKFKIPSGTTIDSSTRMWMIVRYKLAKA